MKRVVPLGCLFLAILVGAIGLGILAPVQFAWALATGWVTYAIRVLPGITVNWEMVACGVGALALSLLIGHRFLVWLAARHPGLPSPWRLRSTLAVNSLLLLLFGASIAMTGIVHQLAWLARDPLLADGGFRSGRPAIAEQINNVKQLKYALDGYAIDFDGKYPARLSDLVEAGELDAANLRVLQLWRPSPDAVGEPWLYLGGALTNNSDPSAPMLIQPRPDPDGRIIVLRVDGSAKWLPWRQVPDDIRALVLPP